MRATASHAARLQSKANADRSREWALRLKRPFVFVRVEAAIQYRSPDTFAVTTVIVILPAMFTFNFFFHGKPVFPIDTD
jgi:hypothetical protein